MTGCQYVDKDLIGYKGANECIADKLKRQRQDLKNYSTQVVNCVFELLLIDPVVFHP